VILCSCTRLTSARLSKVLHERLRNDPYILVTPGRIFAMTGHRMQCGRCAPLVNSFAAKELQRLQAAFPADLPTQKPQSRKD